MKNSKQNRKSFQRLKVCTSKFRERKNSWRRLFKKKSDSTKTNSNNYKNYYYKNNNLNRRII